MGDLSLFRKRLTLVWQALAGRHRAKQSERRLRAFVAATSDVVYCMSPDWSVMYPLQGKHFIADTQNPERDWLQKYIHPDDQAHVMAAIGAAIRTRKTFELEHRVRRVDGTLGWTFSRAIPLTNAAGEITEWFGAASDITQRKEDEAKLQAQLAHQAKLYGALQSAYDDLRRTQQAVMQQERLLALGQMASGIAHDINNAISPIAIYTDLMLRATDLPAEAHSQLAIIQGAIDNVAQTVGRMREFYRTRESEQDLKPVDLNGVVLHALELTRARWSDMAHQRGVVIDVRTELEPELPLIAGTESELRDVLTHLILNALDAMPMGGELRVTTRASNGNLVELEVTDTGGGMDEETRRRCLDPFFTTKGQRGTGLGLAMVYGAVRRHGAELDIRSAVGRGTTMTLTFNMLTGDRRMRLQRVAASL